MSRSRVKVTIGRTPVTITGSPVRTVTGTWWLCPRCFTQGWAERWPDAVTSAHKHGAWHYPRP